MLKEYIVWKFNKIHAIYFFNTILNKFFILQILLKRLNIFKKHDTIQMFVKNKN